MNLLSTLVLIPLIISCLDCLNHLEEANDGVEGADGICYEEPDLSGGVEGVDYLIVYRTGEGPEEDNAWEHLVVVVVEQHELYSI